MLNLEHHAFVFTGTRQIHYINGKRVSPPLTAIELIEYSNAWPLREGKTLTFWREKK